MFGQDSEGIFKRIADDAFKNAVEMAVKEVIAKNAGSGIDSTVKELIRAEAKRIITEEPEFTDMIRKQLRYWIEKAGSGDKEKSRY